LQLLYDDTIANLLPDIENEVLLVVGLQDEVVPPSNTRSMAAVLPRPWMVMVEGRHAAWLQHMPTFLRVSSAFLDETSSS